MRTGMPAASSAARTSPAADASEWLYDMNTGAATAAATGAGFDSASAWPIASSLNASRLRAFA
jgi:hypothetical protein